MTAAPRTPPTPTCVRAGLAVGSPQALELQATRELLRLSVPQEGLQWAESKATSCCGGQQLPTWPLINHGGLHATLNCAC